MAKVAVQKKNSIWNELQKVEERIIRCAYDIFRGNQRCTV